jgi:hypothetical protein
MSNTDHNYTRLRFNSIKLWPECHCTRYPTDASALKRLTITALFTENAVNTNSYWQLALLTHAIESFWTSLISTRRSLIPQSMLPQI